MWVAPSKHEPKKKQNERERERDRERKGKRGAVNGRDICGLAMQQSLCVLGTSITEIYVRKLKYKVILVKWIVSVTVRRCPVVVVAYFKIFMYLTWFPTSST